MNNKLWMVTEVQCRSERWHKCQMTRTTTSFCARIIPTPRPHYKI
jgi:hypothetical protein